MKFKLLGVATFLGGLVAGWYWILGPLRQAQAHAPAIDFDDRLVAVVPGLIVMGLMLMTWGERVWIVLHGTPDNARDWGYRIGMLALVAGLAWLTWVWFSGQMAALGYAQEATAG